MKESKLSKRLLFLSFLHGMICASILYTGIQMTRENHVFNWLRDNIKLRTVASSNVDSLLVTATELTSSIMETRNVVAGGAGAWGNPSEVLARVVQSFGYPVRIAQVKAGGRFGGYSVVEADNGRKWVAMDPIYGLVYKTRNNELASVDELIKDWSYFRGQFPAQFGYGYRYEDVRYTNWEKIPVLLPAVKFMLKIAIGKKATDAICLRTIFLQRNKIYLILFIILECIALFTTIRIRLRNP